MTSTELNEGFELEKKATPTEIVIAGGNDDDDFRIINGKPHYWLYSIQNGKTLAYIPDLQDMCFIKFLRNHALELLEAARKVEEMEKGVTVSFDARDEAYCDWYECSGCKNTMITENSNFCPNCGKKIIR